MKKVIILSLSAITFIVGGVCSNMYPFSKSSNMLLLENVEALSVSETHTTWNCDGKNKKQCCKRCGACGTHVHGSGKVTGSHSCS